MAVDVWRGHDFDIGLPRDPGKPTQSLGRETPVDELVALIHLAGLVDLDSRGVARQVRTVGLDDTPRPASARRPTPAATRSGRSPDAGSRSTGPGRSVRQSFGRRARPSAGSRRSSRGRRQSRGSRHRRSERCRTGHGPSRRTARCRSRPRDARPAARPGSCKSRRTPQRQARCARQNVPRPAREDGRRDPGPGPECRCRDPARRCETTTEPSHEAAPPPPGWWRSAAGPRRCVQPGRFRDRLRRNHLGSTEDHLTLSALGPTAPPHATPEPKPCPRREHATVGTVDAHSGRESPALPCVFRREGGGLGDRSSGRQTSSFAAGGQVRRGAAGGPATQLVCGRDGTALVFEPLQGVGLVGPCLSRSPPAGPRTALRRAGSRAPHRGRGGVVAVPAQAP